MDDENSQDTKLKQEYAGKEAILCLIDVTSSMFDVMNEPNKPITYFQQALYIYSEILKNKVAWSRHDLSGLIFFGTNEYEDPLIKYISTIQDLDLIDIERLRTVLEMCDSKWKNYEKKCASNVYPLCTAINHAIAKFFSLKEDLLLRRIIIFTNRDNHPSISDTDKHNLLKRISTLDGYINLNIVGLTSTWNPCSFYRDLEILSHNTNAEDYKPIKWEELIQRIKVPAHTIANLPLRIGKNLSIEVAVQNFFSSTDYIKTIKVRKVDNAPLYPQTVFEKEKIDYESDSSEDDDNPFRDDYVLPDELLVTQTFGDRTIYLTPEEKKIFLNTSEIGIDIIASKPIIYDPLYHMNPVKFVNLPKKTSKNIHENKQNTLFHMLLYQCAEKELMFVCTVTIKKNYTSKHAYLIPDIEKGGFYLYNLPYSSNVVDLDEHFSNFIYPEDESPINPDAVAVAKKIMKKTTIDPSMLSITNPKLALQIHYLERMTLEELVDSEPPIDETLPREKEIMEGIGKYTKMFEYLTNDSELTEIQVKLEDKKFKNKNKNNMIL